MKTLLLKRTFHEYFPRDISAHMHIYKYEKDARRIIKGYNHFLDKTIKYLLNSIGFLCLHGGVGNLESSCRIITIFVTHLPLFENGNPVFFLMLFNYKTMCVKEQGQFLCTTLPKKKRRSRGLQ